MDPEVHMNTETMHGTVLSAAAPLLLTFALLWSGSVLAQVPVDEEGNPLEAVDLEATAGQDQFAAEDANATPVVVDEEPPMTQEELEALVGPIALYPDKLLAIVLPASTYPLEIVQAARFLEQLEDDSSLEPDESWDDSVAALLNYPEVVKMMNDDIDWTWRLGEAVVRQQPDVIAAVESFRDKAYAAGNLKTDERQRVSNNEGVIEIEPIEEDIIYVPYYEPERVVHYQPRQVYYYYPRPYPVYYYPYPSHHSFLSGYFWGVTTAFSIGWTTDHLHVFHHSYWGHPYYGRQYFGHYYRRPSITVYNRFYPNSHRNRSYDHHRNGDYWRPRDGGPRPGHYRARLERFGDRSRARSVEGYRVPDRNGRVANSRAGFSRDAGSTARSGETREGFAASRRAQVRDREDLARAPRANRQPAGSNGADTIRFRPRARANVDGIANRVLPDRRQDSNAAARTAERAETANPSQRRDDSIRFRSRDNQDAATRARPGVSTSPANSSNSTARARAGSTERGAVRDRSTRPPAARSAPQTSGFRASPGRSAPAARPDVSRPQATRRAAPAPRVSKPQAAPRTAPAPSARAPRASAPRASAPRASAPARAPKASSSARRSSGASSSRTHRTREH